MEITYTDEKKFTKEQTQQLFRSVGWVSGKYPERLYKALMGSSTVFSAWDGDRLVGLVRVLRVPFVASSHAAILSGEACKPTLRCIGGYSKKQYPRH